MNTAQKTQNSCNSLLKPVKWERKQPASARLLALLHYIKLYYNATVDRQNCKLYVSFAYIRDTHEEERTLLKAFIDEFGKEFDIIFV